MATTQPTPAAPPAEQPQPSAPVMKPQFSASLYIGDLSPEVGESTLFEFFKDIGNVASIRVCRDAMSRVSLGYAYVNFHTVDAAEKAINVLNGESLSGRPCRIMWSKRDPSIRRSGVGNIYIKNLSRDIDHGQLYDLFSVFGNILSCKLVTDERGRSKGYGFVHFQDKDVATQAINKMNNMKLNDKLITVVHFVPRHERNAIPPEEVYTNVYFKNLPDSLTEEEFLAEFSKYGQITSSVLMKDDQGKPKGFGFANFATHDQAVKCVTEAHESDFRGHTLYVARAQQKKEREMFLRKTSDERANRFQGANLYMKNLDEAVTEHELRSLFEPFGTITSVKIMTNDKGQSKLFGFVCFSSPNEANKALSEMNSFMVRGKPLYVAMAQRKEQRRVYLEQQYSHKMRNPIGHMMGPFSPAPGFLGYPGRSAAPFPVFPSPMSSYRTNPAGRAPYFPQQGQRRGGPGPVRGAPHASRNSNPRNSKPDEREQLFQYVSQEYHRAIAEKITTAILQFTPPERLHALLSNPEQLKTAVTDAASKVSDLQTN